VKRFSCFISVLFQFYFNWARTFTLLNRRYYNVIVAVSLLSVLFYTPFGDRKVTSCLAAFVVNFGTVSFRSFFVFVLFYFRFELHVVSEILVLLRSD